MFLFDCTAFILLFVLFANICGITDEHILFNNKENKEIIHAWIKCLKKLNFLFFILEIDRPISNYKKIICTLLTPHKHYPFYRNDSERFPRDTKLKRSRMFRQHIKRRSEILTAHPVQGN